MSDSEKSLDLFLERLCFSFAQEIHTSCFHDTLYGHLPIQIELYGARCSLLTRVRDKVFTNLWILKSPRYFSSSSFRFSKKWPIIQPGTYYLDVGYFLRLYEKKSASGGKSFFKNSEVAKNLVSFCLGFLLIRVLKH